MLKSAPTATVTALDLEAFAAASRAAETFARVAATRRDRNVPVSDDDIEGIVSAATHGDAELRERVIRILQAGR